MALSNSKVPSLKAPSFKTVSFKPGTGVIKVPKVSGGKITASVSRPAKLVVAKGAGTP